jgi:cell wall-associated NlpC family hydrolase
MDFPQGGQGPRKDSLALPGFALVFSVHCFLGGCSFTHVDSTSDVASAIRDSSAYSAVCRNDADFVRHREFDYSILFSRDNDYFTTSDSEYSADSSSVTDTDEVESVLSVGDIVLAQYEDWRGVRYRFGGTDYRGIDCSALVQVVFKDAFEMDLPRTSREQAKLGHPVPRVQIQPGDLLYFIDRGRRHVGVAVNEHEFLHASRKKGVTLSKFDNYWNLRLKRVRRILDGEEQQVAAFPSSGG